MTIMNDILIAGRDRDHHEKATQYNLKLKFEKCKVHITSVLYVGHLITREGCSYSYTVPAISKLTAIRYDTIPYDTIRYDKRYL